MTIRRNDFEPSDNLIDKSLLSTIHALLQSYECITLFVVIAAVREISSYNTWTTNRRKNMYYIFLDNMQSLLEY